MCIAPTIALTTHSFVCVGQGLGLGGGGVGGKKKNKDRTMDTLLSQSITQKEQS